MSSEILFNESVRRPRQGAAPDREPLPFRLALSIYGLCLQYFLFVPQETARADRIDYAAMRVWFGSDLSRPLQEFWLLLVFYSGVCRRNVYHTGT